MPFNLIKGTSTEDTVPASKPTNLLRAPAQTSSPTNLLTQPLTAKVEGEGGFERRSVGDVSTYQIQAPEFKKQGVGEALKYIQPEWSKIGTEYNFEDVLSGKPLKTQLKKDIGIVHQTAQGVLGALSFGIVPRLVQELPKESQEFLAPKNTVEEIAYRAGNLWGFSSAVKGMLTKGPLASIEALKPTTVKGIIGKHLLKGGLTIGGYNFLSEWGGKDILDNLKRRAVGGAQGFGVGMAFGAINMVTGEVLSELAGKVKLNPKDSWTALTAFALRLGANELLVAGPAYERYKKGEETLPGLIYEIGLGIMFSASKNPLRLELDFNRAVKLQHDIKAMTKEGLDTHLINYKDLREISMDVKWAAIIKMSGGTIKPSQQNAGSGDYIFEQLLKSRSPQVYETLKTLTDIKVGIETQMEGVKQAMEAKGDPYSLPVSDIVGGDIKVSYKTETKKIKVPRTIKDNEKYQLEKTIEEIATETYTSYKLIIKDPSYQLTEGDIELNNKYPEIDWEHGQEGKCTIVYSSGSRDIYVDWVSAKGAAGTIGGSGKGFRMMRDLLSHVVSEHPEAETVSGIPVHTQTEKLSNKIGAGKGIGTNKVIPIKDIKKFLVRTKNVSTISEAYAEGTKSLKSDEVDLNIEMATGRDVGVLKRTGRAMGLNDKMINRFLKAYTDGDITLSKIKGKVPKEQLEQLRQLMKQLTSRGNGGIKIPTSKELVPPGFTEWRKSRAWPWDWLQSARIPIKPIYDLVKPAYTSYMEGRRAACSALEKIYAGKVKIGSEISKKIAMYADGKINLDDLPVEYRDIALDREKFYQDYADKLLKLGNLKPSDVFDKDGNRKPYYHHIFDSALQKVYDAGFALDDLYLPGKMPLAGALRKRRGAWGYRYDAVESDLRYMYGIEKYINMHREMEAATAYANQITGIRRSMANAYLRAMRGQPTNVDRVIKESMQSISSGMGTMLKEMGMDSIGQKLIDWKAPTYPVARATSPLARIYYWRYIGLAMDTAFKNVFQMTHTLARYGADNVAKAQRMIFTPEGKKIIEESGVMSEGIQRGGAFISEGTAGDKLKKIEESSYWVFEKTENNNRRVSALAGYMDANSKGMSHEQSLQEAWKAAHETQYGYTKADSLLIDLANPVARFILFKKWPMGKVEMMRSWIRDGHTDALFNLALTEYVIYRAAQKVGVDLGPQFNAIWQMATRGIEDWKDLFPIVSELADVATMFGGGPDAEKAKERLIKAWQGGGNRYIGKVIEFGRHWLNDWEVRDHNGQLQYQSSMKEQATNLLVKPLEATQRTEKNRRMAQVGQEVEDLKEQIILAFINGDDDRAYRLQMQMENKYGEEYAQEFGKAIKPITSKDIIEYRKKQETTTSERVRRGMPGKGAPVKGRQEFQGAPQPTNLLRAVRGY